MPTFTNRPPDDPRGHSLPLLRTPARGQLSGIVTTNDMIGCPTHFHQGRTQPCDVEDCDACHHGIPWRWHAWVGAFNVRNHQAFIFEMTARVASIMVNYREANGGLRGCAFRAQRRTTSPNSRVFLECQPADLQSIDLPQPPDLAACMAIIWNIATPTVDVGGMMRKMPRINVDKNGNGKLVTPDGAIIEPGNESGPATPTLPRPRRNG